MIKESVAKVVAQEDLTQSEMEETMNEIMSGEATPAQIGAFITALRMKGETVEEITGAARVMRAKATKDRYNRSRGKRNDSRHLRHGWRRHQHLQRLHGNRLCGCRRRDNSRQAWKPCGFQQMRKRRCA